MIYKQRKVKHRNKVDVDRIYKSRKVTHYNKER